MLSWHVRFAKGVCRAKRHITDTSLSSMASATLALPCAAFEMVTFFNENHRIPFSDSDDVLELIRVRCMELESGGRMIDAILTNTLLPRISEEMLTHMMDDRSVSKIDVDTVGATVPLLLSTSSSVIVLVAKP